MNENDRAKLGHASNNVEMEKHTDEIHSRNGEYVKQALKILIKISYEFDSCTEPWHRFFRFSGISVRINFDIHGRNRCALVFDAV